MKHEEVADLIEQLNVKLLILTKAKITDPQTWRKVSNGWELAVSNWNLVYQGNRINDYVLDKLIADYLGEESFKLNSKDFVLPFLRDFLNKNFNLWERLFQDNEEALRSTDDWTCIEKTPLTLLQRCYSIYDCALSEVERICKSFSISKNDVLGSHWRLKTHNFSYSNDDDLVVISYKLNQSHLIRSLYFIITEILDITNFDKANLAKMVYYLINGKEAKSKKECQSLLNMISALNKQPNTATVNKNEEIIRKYLQDLNVTG